MNEENHEFTNSTRSREYHEDILEEYLKPKRFQPRFWVWVSFCVAAILLIIIYKTTVLDSAIGPEQLKAGLELFNLDSQWVVSEQIDNKEFKGIVLVPQISFQVRNVGKVVLRYVYFLGVFRLVDQAKILGEGFEMALKTPLDPGKVSERIVLTCQFGYRASSRQAFKQNSKEWRRALVETYAKTGASDLISLKTFYISRRIEGLDMDIKLTDMPTGEKN
jgi:hypothetical protein